MKNSWTGGQYSLVRAIFGLYLFVRFAALVPDVPVLAVAAIAALCFAVGWRDRIAAIVMACVLAWLFGRAAPAAGLWLPLAGLLLLLHACVPRAPFLSMDARNRVDPRGGWSMPPTVFAAMWVLLFLGYACIGWTKLAGRSLVPAAAPFGFAATGLMMVILHLFTFDPGWVPRRLPATTDKVLYDGTCGLCHRGMRWLIAEDRTGTSFRYAPLGTERPDSVIVQTEAGEVLVRSAAALHLLGRMGGLWRVIGVLFALLPRRVRDAMYDFVARVRYRIFGRTKDACPLVPPDLRTRFDG